MAIEGDFMAEAILQIGISRMWKREAVFFLLNSRSLFYEI